MISIPRLVELLGDASEVEHCICLQYLYAAFSLKMRPSEGHVTSLQIEKIREWKAALLEISRQEMLHLALVTNLRAAIGAAPRFERPEFPFQSDFYPVGLQTSLSTFGLEALDQFIYLESPVLADREGIRHVGNLYRQIRNAFTELPERAVFIGDPRKQVSRDDVLDPNGDFEEEVITGYGVEPFSICDRASALRAIDLIVEQGEGASNRCEDSHYHRLCRIRNEYIAERRACPEFEPVRCVLQDASLQKITNPATLQVARLFNHCYQTMMIMMTRFYARLNETPAEFYGLQQIVFFPLMTMVVRPLGEVLTELPANESAAQLRAGPTFELTCNVTLIENKAEAFTEFDQRLKTAAHLAGTLAYLKDENPPNAALRTRLRFIAENIQRLAFNFRELTT